MSAYLRTTFYTAPNFGRLPYELIAGDLALVITGSRDEHRFRTEAQC